MAEESKKKKRKRLREVRSVHADDGSIVHHHTYEKDDGSGNEPERQNVATSQDAEEAGQHVADQLGMNEQQPEQQGAPESEAAPGAAEQ